MTNPIGIRWVLTKNQTENLTDFVEFANITEAPEDFLQRNPGFFWPEHCYGVGVKNPNYTNFFPDQEESETLAPRRNFTAIGYIAANNQIERDVLAQLNLMFLKQQNTYPGLYHKYKFIKFNTYKEIVSYVRDKDYTFDQEKPGLCFAFEIKK